MYVFNNRRSTHPYEACFQERLWSLLSHCQYLIGVESLKDESCSRSDRPIGRQAGPIFVRETTKTILREYLPESTFTSQSQHSRVFISCDQGISKRGFDATVVNGTVSLIGHWLWEWTRESLGGYGTFSSRGICSLANTESLTRKGFSQIILGNWLFTLEGEPDFLGCSTPALQ